MRQILALTIFILLAFSSVAKPIDEATAKKVGYAFFNTKTKAVGTSIESLQLVYKAFGKRVFQTEDAKANIYFYIFNSKSGFVIVSGDDVAIPVLGYSIERKFDTTNIPINVLKWFEGYKDAIRYAVEKKIPQTKENTEQWQNLIDYSPNQSNNQTLGTTTFGTGTPPFIGPLVQTRWNQSPYYNDLCPYSYEYIILKKQAVTGCVATAMAQVMKYWNYPQRGFGDHTYNSNTYGTQYADFGGTTYNWTSMPNSVTSTNNAVATLMYHCGVSVDMDYGVNQSSANPFKIADALKNYFGYNNTVRILQRDYTFFWLDTLKNEINNGRPIIYGGMATNPTAGGHCFVADGYDSNDFIHFNWGWGGLSDGYFSIYDINPNSLGTGGGAGGGYNGTQTAIIGIQPPPNSLNYSLKLYNSVTPSSSTISYGQPFTISTNITNTGNLTFNGDYVARIFDNAGTFVKDVEIKLNQSLPINNHYINNLVFSTTGIVAMMPGTYTVGIYSRPTGGQWSLVANNGSYTNFPTITVTYNNIIALNSVMTPNPSTLIKGQSASVNLNIVNTGSTTFKGKYYTALFNLDGTFAQMIDSVTENNGLQANYTYLSPYLTFNTPSISVSPGSYLLAALHAPTGGSTQLTGANLYQNPTKVIVKAADLLPDIYEVNNTASQASNLPITFTGNTAYKNTVGSNCHVGNDYDYYKITLPAGSNYQIKPRLQDSYNNNNGNTYTLDAVFAYSFDSTNWSQAYDDTLTTNVALNNGGTIYFVVAPYYAGNVGTYLLEMNIVKSIITPVVLTSFTAELKNKVVELKWSTSSEINTSHYNIQRSYNGLDFNKIGSVNANGNTTSISNYNFNDSTPSSINYYRLKQVDNDGKYSYSDVKLVRLSELKSSIVIAPNPASSQATIFFKTQVANAVINVYDVQGKLVLTQNAANTNQAILKTDKLNSGTYMVNIIADGQVSNQQLVISK